MFIIFAKLGFPTTKQSYVRLNSFVKVLQPAALFTTDEIKSLLIQNGLSVWSKDLVKECVLEWAEDNQEILHFTSFGEDLTKNSDIICPEIETAPPAYTLAEILSAHGAYWWRRSLREQVLAE